MKYEDMREWRDIAEFLEPLSYKYAKAEDEGLQGFKFLSLTYKPYRADLWSSYMLQVCQFTPDPYSYYHRVKKRDLTWGWRLLLDWEEKIDFLEQVVLFGKNPDDVPQPWKARIWQKLFERTYGHFNSFNIAFDGACPIKFDCKSMTGVQDAASCINKIQCELLFHSL